MRLSVLLCCLPGLAAGATAQEPGAPSVEARTVGEVLAPAWYPVPVRASSTADAGRLDDLPRTAAPRPSGMVTGAAALGLSLVAATLLDQDIRDRVAATDPDDPLWASHVGNALGHGGMALVATSATWGLSRIVGYDELADPAGRVLLSLIAAGAVNGVMKASFGRARPRLEMGPHEFRPLAFDNGWQSFPSGHVVTAFALATAISAEADRPWVSGVTYSAAGLVAWSRSHEDRHWASDIVAGAAVGTIAAYYISRLLQRRAGRRDQPADARLLLGPTVIGVVIPLP